MIRVRFQDQTIHVGVVPREDVPLAKVMVTRGANAVGYPFHQHVTTPLEAVVLSREVSGVLLQAVATMALG